MNIVVFAGSAEARRWINQSRKKGYKLWVFVNSSVAKELLNEEDDNLKVFVEREVNWNTREFFPMEPVALVDGTHPYNRDQSHALTRMAEKLDIHYIRLLPEERAPQGVRVFSSLDEARTYLEEGKGNILITTGMDSLEELISPKLHLRAFARIEPRQENLKRVRELGLGHRQILALMGPFSQEMNQAMINQYKIQVLVTEESGFQEGVEEKAYAALKSGVELVVIRDMKRKGLNIHQLDEYLESLI